MLDSQGKYHAFQGALLFSLTDFREVDANGDVGAITLAADTGGLLVSNSTPIYEGDTAESQRINWAAANSDIIATQTVLPPDFDGREAATVEMWVASGTTDPASFTCETGWDGGTLVSTTVTDGAKSATIHKITATIPASSIPDTPSFLTVELTPAAHTTNAIFLYGLRISYFRKTQA